MNERSQPPSQPPEGADPLPGKRAGDDEAVALRTLLALAMARARGDRSLVAALERLARRTEIDPKQLTLITEIETRLAGTDPDDVQALHDLLSGVGSETEGEATAVLGAAERATITPEALPSVSDLPSPEVVAGAAPLEVDKNPATDALGRAELEVTLAGAGELVVIDAEAAKIAIPPPLDTGPLDPNADTSAPTSVEPAFPRTVASPVTRRVSGDTEVDLPVLDSFTRTDTGGYVLPGQQGWLGPFAVTGWYDDRRTHGLYQAQEVSSRRTCTVRLFPPRRVTKRSRAAVLSRLAQASSTIGASPVAGALVSVYAADVYAIARQGDAGLPVGMRRQRGGTFGLLEEDRRQWRTLLSWLKAEPPPPLLDRLVVARTVARAVADLRDRGLPHGQFDETRVFLSDAGRPKVAGWAWADCFSKSDESGGDGDPILHDGSGGSMPGLDAGGRGGEHDAGLDAFGRRTWYRPPEAVIGGPQVDNAAAGDAYALGVLLYRMTTGQLPPEWTSCDSLMASIQAIEQGIVTAPRSLVPGLPPRLDAMIQRATATSADRRFASGHEIATELEGIVAGLAGESPAVLRNSAPTSIADARPPAPLGKRRSLPLATRGDTTPGPARARVRANRPSACYPFDRMADVEPAYIPEAYRHLRTLRMRGARSIHQVQHNQTGAVFAMKLFTLLEGAITSSDERRPLALPSGDVALAAALAANELAMLERCQLDAVVTLQDHGTRPIDDGTGEIRYLVLEWAQGWRLGEVAETQIGTRGPQRTPSSQDLAPEQSDENVCRSLADLERPLAEPAVVWCLQQALHALHQCHELGVVHYDAKPANLLCFARGALKLSDFGVANYQLAYAPVRRGDVFGSPAYVSPEQTIGHEEPQPRSDLFTTGVWAYEFLTGARPFRMSHRDPRGLSLPEFEPVTDLAALAPKCSRELVSLIESLLALDPSDRPRTAAEAYEQLRATPHHPASWQAIRGTLRRRGSEK